MGEGAVDLSPKPCSWPNDMLYVWQGAHAFSASLRFAQKEGRCKHSTDAGKAEKLSLSLLYPSHASPVR